MEKFGSRFMDTRSICLCASLFLFSLAIGNLLYSQACIVSIMLHNYKYKKSLIVNHQCKNKRYH
jgi:hypothetical protein